MRLDKFLVVARLVRQRSKAKQVCDGGLALVNGKTAKAAHAVRVGEVLTLTLPHNQFVAKVVAVPETGNVPKALASSLYKAVGQANAGPRDDERTR